MHAAVRLAAFLAQVSWVALTWVGVLVFLVPLLDGFQPVVVQRPPATYVWVRLPHLFHLITYWMLDGMFQCSE
jgi:hypothetical protein